MIWTVRPRTLLILALAGLQLACASATTDGGRRIRKSVLGPSGAEAAARLEPGLPWATVIAVLSERASVDLQQVATRPESGDWQEVVDHRPSLGALLRATQASDRPIHDFIYLRRNWGVLGADDFYLFFDAEGELISFHRTRLS